MQGFCADGEFAKGVEVDVAAGIGLHGVYAEIVLGLQADVATGIERGGGVGL